MPVNADTKTLGDVAKLLGRQRLHRWDLQVGGRRLSIHGLQDAAALLDEPEFAQEFVELDRAPYWAQLWPASVMLAEAVMALPPGDGRSAVELGCGLGLVSIAAALRGWRVTASDYDQRALELTQNNARANQVELAECVLLDWNTLWMGRQFDLVLAADVLG